MLSVLIPAADALGTSNLSWTTSGDAPWFGQPIVTHSGGYAAQSGRIGDNQQSVLQSAVIGPGTLSFWWRTSSEQYWDTVRFLVDNEECAQLSGETSWLPQTISVPNGAQSLRWIYSKDGGGASGQDTAWLDEVSFAADIPALSILQPARKGNTFSLAVLAAEGKTYFLEYKNSLDGANWTVADQVTGDGTLKTLTDTTALVGQRFYRVRQN
jgi:hypothetical protein